MVGQHYIYTQSGRSLDFENPTADQVSLEDVARGLYREARFANQNLLKTTVLQHTMFMHRLAKATLVDNIDRLAVLLHDAAEAYIRDIPSNLKKLCPQVAEVEGKILRALVERVFLDAEAPRQDIPDLVEEVLKEIRGEKVKNLDAYAGRLEAAISFDPAPPWIGAISGQDRHYMALWYQGKPCSEQDYMNAVVEAARVTIKSSHAKAQ